MPFIEKREIDKDSFLGIWKIAEDYEWMLSRIHLFPGELETLNNFKNHLRKLEWLSVRVLLKELLGPNRTIIYNKQRKPFLKGNSYNISITHSKDITAILLSKARQVGIDMEYMSHRIEMIEHRFINSEEKVTADEQLKRFHLYVHWCAKEALYKICDKQDISLQKNIFITPFLPEKNGNLTGWVKNIHRNEQFNLKYFTLENYIVVYTIK